MIGEPDAWQAIQKPPTPPSDAKNPPTVKHTNPLGMASPLPTRTSTDLYSSPDHLGAIYALESVPGFGPVKFREMHRAGITPQIAVEQPERIPIFGSRGEKLRTAISNLAQSDVARFKTQAEKQLERTKQLGATILTHYDSDYPERVYNSNNPVPVLYIRGNASVWSDSCAVAVVGSRKIRDPYATSTRKFATTAARKGFVVVSGFAVGADSIGHSAACDAYGRTLCVMPCGVDLIFPPENKPLWYKLQAYGDATFVSEFRFGRRASSLSLRKRNKLIVSFAEGVLVAQSSIKGGAMNAYRSGKEQKKPIATFCPDGGDDASGNLAIIHDLNANITTFNLSQNSAQFDSWLNLLSSSI